jgi:hypothetical protein
MLGRRSLVALAAALLALTLVSGTGGFSSVAADRSVNVAVVDDDEAFVGIEKGHIDRCGANQVALTVTNRLGSDLHTVEATVLDDDSDVRATVMDTPGRLGVDDKSHRGEITVRVNPATPANEDAGNGDAVDGTIQVRLTVQGGGVRVGLTRSVAVECPSHASEEQGDNGTGNGDNNS